MTSIRTFDEVVLSSLSFVADTVCVPVEEDIVTAILSQHQTTAKPEARFSKLLKIFLCSS